MIKLGISAAFEYPNPDRLVFGPKTLSYVENDMASYVSKKGILPILIPHVDDEILIDILGELDGFILQGGSDIAPETYNEKPIGRWKGDRTRDLYELKVLDYAIRNEKPIFGICRGFQLMNVYFGGTLYQDTLTQRPDSLDHRSAELYDTVKHQIYFNKGRVLDLLYEGVVFPYVNTVHHQSIKDLGKDLEVWATSSDGIIEAFGYTKAPEGKVFGVQWHPEFSPTLGTEVIDENLLFNLFLKYLRS